MNSTIALMVNIPTLLLLYIMIYFTQTLSGKRQFYGVSLNSDYFKYEEFKRLDKKFKALVTIGFVVFTLIALICIYSFEAYEVSSILPMLGFCVYQFFAFLYIHNKVKLLKKNLSLEKDNLDLEKTKLILDTSFLSEKNKLIKKYSILYTIPFIATLLISLYTLSQYSSIPEIIPTHWGISGVADAFSEKSTSTIGGIIAMTAGVGLMIFVSSIASLKSRGKLNVSDTDYNTKAHLDHLNKFAFTFLVLNIGCHIMFIAMLIATVNASNISMVLMWICTTLIILGAIYQTYLYYKSPNKSKSASYTVDDDDSNWVIGIFYYNPNDPSFFVQKRFGVGWTVNIGTTKGKLFIVLTFLIILSTLFIAFNV